MLRCRLECGYGWKLEHQREIREMEFLEAAVRKEDEWSVVNGKEERVGVLFGETHSI